MSIILGFPIVALLAATGIYNPQLMHNGRCMAELGGLLRALLLYARRSSR